MTVAEYNRRHAEAVQFLDETTRSSRDTRVVVITHHLPSHTLVDPCYSRYRRYQQCFATDLDRLIHAPVICWIYGHTHKPYSGYRNGVRVCCNPIGYPEENGVVDFEQVVELK